MPVIEPKPTTVYFVQNHRPALTAGKYQLTASHSVTVDGQPKTSDSKKPPRTFHVRGDRFSLQPGAIRKVFPPDGARGEFAGALPHVVLTRDTLPWEREPGDPPLPPLANKDKASWLAVLVLDADDPNAKIKTGRVSDLQSNSSLVGYAPNIPNWLVDEEQNPDTPCRYIDLPAALFNAIAPSVADLGWLAHVRHVKHDDDSIVELATVMAGRFPRPGKKSLAVLVSLEGLAGYLPGSDGSPALIRNSRQPQQPMIPATSNVRLIVLKDWSFTAVTEKITFSALVRGLNQGRTDNSLLCLPTTFLDEGPARSALNAGYVALSHRMRTGYSTVSWYRGPLAPGTVSAANVVSLLPVDDADELTFFDGAAAASGMFNMSYAAAWRIGRLLALADQDFSTTLYNWKRQCRALACQKLQDHTPAVGKRADYAKDRTAMLKDSPGGTLVARLGALDTTGNPPTGTSTPFFPLALKSWLADLALFHRVPFHYLVPDEGMLPPESLRLFTVDAAWRRSLLDGAFSIGRGSWPAFDKNYANKIYDAAESAAGITGNTVTGVLLRSSLISGWWPGLIFDGFASSDPGDNDEPMKHLRLERLAPDVAICLFDGEVKCIKIHEPPDGLHFGLRVLAYQDGAVALWQKELRDLDSNHQKTYGKELSPAVVLDGSRLPFRYGQPGVLNVDALATVIKDTYSTAIQSTFSAAEFALSMIEGVEGGVFNNSAS